MEWINEGNDERINTKYTYGFLYAIWAVKFKACLSNNVVWSRSIILCPNLNKHRYKFLDSHRHPGGKKFIFARIKKIINQ